MTSRYAGFRGAVVDFDMTLVYLFDYVDMYGLRRELREMLSRNLFNPDGIRSLPVDLLRRAYERDAGDPGSREERWLEASRLVCSYEIRGAERAVPTADTALFLEDMAAAGLRIGIVTSNCEEAVEACLDRLSLRSYFSCVVGRDAVGWKMKPSPAGVEIALRQMGVQPEEAFGIGDSAADMAAYASAGILPIGITGGVSTRRELIEAGARGVTVRLSGTEVALVQATR